MVITVGSLFQVLKRGGIRGSSRQQKAGWVAGGDGDGKEEREMEMVNMKLFWENRCIMEENQRLRKRALALRHENQILLTQLHHHHHNHNHHHLDLNLAVVHDNSNSEDVGGGTDAQLPACHHPQRHQQHHDHPSNP